MFWGHVHHHKVSTWLWFGFFLSFSKACSEITLHWARVSFLKQMFSSFTSNFMNSLFLTFWDDSSSPRKRSLSGSVFDCCSTLWNFRWSEFGRLVRQIWAKWFFPWNLLHVVPNAFVLVYGESHNDGCFTLLVLEPVFLVEVLFSADVYSCCF